MPESEVIQIGHRKNPKSQISVTSGVEIFFLIGLLGAAYGTVWLGVHLWMMINGQMDMWSDYLTQRHIHAIMQIYLFIGLFIMGFCYQAAAKQLEVKEPKPELAVVLTVFPLMGLLYQTINPLVGKVVLALPYFLTAIYVFSLLLKSSLKNIFSVGILLLCGLLALTRGVFLNVADPAMAVMVVWGGIGGVLLATQQQFLAGFFGAQRITGAGAFFTNLFYLCSLYNCYMFVSLRDFGHYKWVSIFASLTILTFILSTKGWKVIRSMLIDPLALAFSFGYLWALYGALLMFQEIVSNDLIQHTWSTGWIFPIIFATSLKIISFLSQKELMKPNTQIVMIVLWQIVPLGRAVLPLYTSLAVLPWLVGIAATVVFVSWFYCLLKGILTVRKLNEKAASLRSA
ncbi:MAG: hypothetical protein D6808_06585 [Candidatus Dadabacteria bacterium]|nr:MAG: hypothetical protein D6808_06585 [Candidatus Dadabacteria bacterium]